MLLGLVAAREGTSPVVYYHTRTPAEFALGVQAWIESVATPAAMLIGSTRGGTGTGRNGAPQGRAAASSVKGPPSRRDRYEGLLNMARKYRSGRGTTRETIHDLDELLPIGKEWTPEARHRVKAAASQALSARIGR